MHFLLIFYKPEFSREANSDEHQKGVTKVSDAVVVLCASEVAGGRGRHHIDRQKLVDYCLNLEHPRGKHKARVFATAQGSLSRMPINFALCCSRQLQPRMRSLRPRTDTAIATRT